MKKILIAVALLIFPIQTVLASNYDGNYECDAQYVQYKDGFAAIKNDEGFEFISLVPNLQIIQGVELKESAPMGFINKDVHKDDLEYLAEQINENLRFNLLVSENTGVIEFKNGMPNKFFRHYEKQDENEPFRIGIMTSDGEDQLYFSDFVIGYLIPVIEDTIFKLDYYDYSDEIQSKEVDRIFKFLIDNSYEGWIKREFKLEKHLDGNQLTFTTTNVANLTDFNIFGTELFKSNCKLTN